MSFLTTIATTVLTPIAGKLITSYIAPKIEPVIEKVKEIEGELNVATFIDKNSLNEEKYRQLLLFIKTTPYLSKFIYDCGWSSIDIDKIAKFCVLITKKPITDAKSREKWNADDARIVFDFFCVIAMKWIKAFKGKR